MGRGWLPKLQRCKNQRCESKVSVGIAYCCSACAHAHENNYEIHDHSDTCKERQEQRKDIKIW